MQSNASRAPSNARSWMRRAGLLSEAGKAELSNGPSEARSAAQTAASAERKKKHWIPAFAGMTSKRKRDEQRRT
jgi:hypothetical protein